MFYAGKSQNEREIDIQKANAWMDPQGRERGPYYSSSMITITPLEWEVM